MVIWVYIIEDFCKKSDIDNLKSDMRIAIQEIILAIDYSNLQIN